MTATFGGFGERIRQDIIAVTWNGHRPRWPFRAAPLPSPLTKKFSVVALIVMKDPGRALFIHNVLDFLLLAIIENLKVVSGQTMNHDAVYKIFNSIIALFISLP
jgi:hypothetical protein